MYMYMYNMVFGIATGQLWEPGQDTQYAQSVHCMDSIISVCGQTYDLNVITYHVHQYICIVIRVIDSRFGWHDTKAQTCGYHMTTCDMVVITYSTNNGKKPVPT